MTNNMTNKNQTLATMLEGQNLLRDLNREMQKLATAQRATAGRHKHFKELTAPKQKGGNGISGVMFENMLMGLLMESLFGLPFLSDLGASPETLQALGATGSAMHHDAAEKPHPMETSAMLSTMLMDAQKQRLEAATETQENQAAELARMKKLMVMLLATMLLQQRGEKSGDDDMVPDVLRDPKIARFKQNRQSISCIKTLFAKQSAAMAPPALRCA